MFRKTDPQRSLLECEFLVPPEKVERLADGFSMVFGGEAVSARYRGPPDSSLFDPR